MRMRKLVVLCMIFATFMTGVPVSAAPTTSVNLSSCTLRAGYPYRYQNWAEGSSFASCSRGYEVLIHLTLQQWVRDRGYWGTVSSTGWRKNGQFTRGRCTISWGDHSSRAFRLITKFDQRGPNGDTIRSVTHYADLRCVRRF